MMCVASAFSGCAIEVQWCVGGRECDNVSDVQLSWLR